MNPYKVLGIEKNSSNDDIRKQYIKLAMKYHPDRNKNRSIEIQQEYEEKFKEINEAYSKINNNIDTDFNFTDDSIFDRFKNLDYKDIANKFLKEASLFSKFMFDQNEVYTNNINVNLNIDLFDIYNNIKKNFNLEITKRCKKCMGIGVKVNENNFVPCNNCYGAKYLTQKKEFEIYSGEGKQIFFKQSNEEYGKKTGNVIVNIIPKKNDTYIIQNYIDICYYVNKANISFTYLDNKQYILNNLEENKKYCFKNYGLLNNNMQRGDLYIIFIKTLCEVDFSKKLIS
jgi:DnaJ-class molecular chaperone